LNDQPQGYGVHACIRRKVVRVNLVRGPGRSDRSSQKIGASLCLTQLSRAVPDRRFRGSTGQSTKFQDSFVDVVLPFRLRVVSAEILDLGACVLDATKLNERIDEVVSSPVGLVRFRILSESFTELLLGFNKIAIMLILDTFVKQPAGFRVFHRRLCSAR